MVTAAAARLATRLSPYWCLEMRWPVWVEAHTRGWCVRTKAERRIFFEDTGPAGGQAVIKSYLFCVTVYKRLANV